MKHQVKKIRFGHGYDYDKALIRKLAGGFLRSGSVEITLAKAKAIKPLIETLVTKMKTDNQSNRNYLLKVLNDQALIDKGYETFGKALADIKGGYLRIIKIGYRDSDGSELARLEWAHPIVVVKKEKEVATKK